MIYLLVLCHLCWVSWSHSCRWWLGCRNNSGLTHMSGTLVPGSWLGHLCPHACSLQKHSPDHPTRSLRKAKEGKWQPPHLIKPRLWTRTTSPLPNLVVQSVLTPTQMQGRSNRFPFFNLRNCEDIQAQKELLWPFPLFSTFSRIWSCWNLLAGWSQECSCLFFSHFVYIGTLLSTIPII